MTRGETDLDYYLKHETAVLQSAVGSTIIGGTEDLIVQSMLTTATLDSQACIQQCIRLIEAGCEMIRITAANIAEAENLQKIKEGLLERGYAIPLIADIHYTPNAAMVAASIVDKIRINPGNFVKSKMLSKKEELDLIKETIKPILDICKLNGTAVRIGVNHGSLSDRMMQKYGDSSEGMVASAMEYLQICEELNFHNLVISLKASQVKVMIRANRLLQSLMLKSGRIYPLHLGVTEAGSGLEGRIKSSIGISTLLADGIGDTIRVSLTEEPEAEIPVAHFLKRRFPKTNSKGRIPIPLPNYNYRKKAKKIRNIGGDQAAVVVADLSQIKGIQYCDLQSIGYSYSIGEWKAGDQASDYIYVGKNIPKIDMPPQLGVIYDFLPSIPFQENYFPLFDSENIEMNHLNPIMNFVQIKSKEYKSDFLHSLKAEVNIVLIIESECTDDLEQERKVFNFLESHSFNLPVIPKRQYPKLQMEEFLLSSSGDFGKLLVDGMGNGIWTIAENVGLCDQNKINFGILQAIGDRITKTEYVSCPSCGRAKFNVQETKEKIETVTQHLKGIKIGVMGCIVNGPGEMADADYGFVGSGKGKITLYRKNQVVKKDIPEAYATEALVDLIKQHGDWKEAEL